MKINSFIFRSLNFIKKNKVYSLILILILIVGAFFRLYKISEYMTFLGDEGRDALVVKRLLLDHDLVFVGPGTSVGNMYLGPFYYYFMAPFLFLFRFDPTGPAVGVALLGVLTIFFVWYLAYKWFGRRAGLTAALLYAFSPVVIIFSRHSWNPNIMPFFSLLVIYSTFKFWYEEKYSYIVLASLSFAICLQSHYLALVLLPFVGIFLLLSFIKSKKVGKQKELLKNFLISVVIFLLLMSPLVVFDAKYNWRNFTAMKDFFFERSDFISNSFMSPFLHFFTIWNLVFTRLLASKNILFGKIVAFLLFSLSFLQVVFYLKRRIYSKKVVAFFFVLSWILVSVFVLSVYKEQIYDHYFGFLFPAPFLLLSFFLEELVTFKRYGKFLFVPLIFLFLFFSFVNSPLRDNPSRQLQRTIDVSKKIAEEARGQRFNLAVIAERNYEGAYLYFLELWKEPVVIIDPQRASETITDQLFVVCEYEDKTKCQPVSNPKAEVANFGWSKIDKSFNVDGLMVFRLVHNPSGKPE